MRYCDFLAAPPAPDRTMRVLAAVRDLLGVRVAYFYAGAYHFRVGPPGASVAITPESADRFRVDACRWSRPLATLYTLATDDHRLAEAVTSLARELEGVPEGA